MSNKEMQQLQLIRERMIAAGIEETEVDRLVNPLAEELQRRVCGLVWEHTMTSIPDIEGKIPALTPVTEKNIVNDISGNNHVLIEGENLLALMAMQYTHIDENGKGMIDVIYIDPPYNTGSVSFAYNDKFEKSEWLSMMDIRLKLARNLLKDDGVIFISIDDSYLYDLKLLCDDVFGSHCFMTNIVNQSANSVYGMKSAHKDKAYIKVKDYVLVYAKSGNITVNPIYTPSKVYIYDSHEFVLEGSTRYSTVEWFKWKHADVFKKYGFAVNKRNIQKIMEVDQDFRSKVVAELLDKQYGTWPYTKKDLTDEEIALLNRGDIITHNGMMIIRENNGTGLIRYLRSLRESCQKIDGEYVKVDVLGDVWNNSAGYGNINAEGNVKFTNGKKPLMLLKRILASITTKNALIFDFFAGSGTTGHAVLDLNKEDGGHRQFILCTNNELGKDAKKKAKKNGYEEGSEEYEALGVCRAVTYPRMQNIFPGYPGNNLYYYRIDQDGEPHEKREEKINALKRCLLNT